MLGLLFATPFLFSSLPFLFDHELSGFHLSLVAVLLSYSSWSLYPGGRRFQVSLAVLLLFKLVPLPRWSSLSNLTGYVGCLDFGLSRFFLSRY